MRVAVVQGVDILDEATTHLVTESAQSVREQECRPVRPAASEQHGAATRLDTREAGNDEYVPITDRVLQEARRLPTRESLLHEADVPGEIERNERSAVRLTQVLMGAAAAILVTTVLFSSDLMRATDSRHLDAVDTKRIEEIDQEIAAEERRREAENRRR